MPSKIYISETDVGKGVFAKRPIKKGEMILRFRGELINSKQIKIREKSRQRNSLQIGNDKYIDLEKPGVLANHSCNPNAGIKEDKILVAIRNIKKDEEIRYDYSATMDEDDWTMKCRCHQKNCRKIVKDFKCLPKSTQKKYLRLNIAQRFIAEKYL